MTAKPLALGSDAPLALKLTWEKHELPGSRKDIILAVASILDAGGTQKVILEVGKPIRVSRLVPEESVPADIPSELVDNDIYSAARNIEISLAEKESDPMTQVYAAFNILGQKGAKPRALIVPQFSQLFTWLKKPPTAKLFGVDVILHKDIPDETALLVGSDPDDEEVITCSVRFELEVPSVREKYEADHRKDAEQRAGGQDDGKAHGAVGLPAGGVNGQGQREPAQGRNKGGAHPVRRGPGG